MAILQGHPLPPLLVVLSAMVTCYGSAYPSSPSKTISLSWGEFSWMGCRAAAAWKRQAHLSFVVFPTLLLFCVSFVLSHSHPI